MPNKPLVSYNVRSQQWTLEHADLQVTTLGHVLVVPVGFESDLASIPRELWEMIAPFELGLAAPLVHDWLYRHGGSIKQLTSKQVPAFTRLDADNFFLDIMQQDGVTLWKQSAAYAAVRNYGASSWRAV